MNSPTQGPRRGKPLSRSQWQSAQQRLRYRRASAEQPIQTNKKSSSKQPMTYDDYISSLAQHEKLFEVEEKAFGEQFRDGVDAFKRFVQRFTRGLVRGAQSVIGAALNHSDKLMPTQVKTRLQPVKRRARRLKVRYGAKRLGIAGGAVSMVILVGVAIFATKSNISGNQITGENGQVQSAVDAEPTFEVIEPTSDEESSPVMYDPKVGVASFQDKIDGVQATISQQPLLEEQKKNQNQFLSEVSTSLLTSGSFESNKGTVHFTTPSGEEGDTAQVVVFIHKDLLIFIRIQGSVLRADQLKIYVDSLE